MGLKTWFINQQIQRKLLLINVLVIIMALLPIVTIMFGYEYYAVRKAVLQEIRVQAAIVSDNAAAAMAFGDATTAKEALSTLQAAPDMLRAALILPDGSMLASYHRNDSSSSPLTDTLDRPTLITVQEKLSWNTFKLSKPVFLKSEFVGSLTLETSLDSFYKRVKLYWLVILVTAFIGLIASLWLALKLKDSIINPLSQLMSSVNRVTQKHDYSVRPMVERTDEIGDLSRAFHDMMTSLQERDERLQDMAYYDGVTSLPNRNFFKERIEQAVSNALRYETRCCLMFIDLDDFKNVNDTLGHHIGDDLLSETGARLANVLRHNDLVCRIGGDEFAVILENVEDLNNPAMLARNIIEAISQPITLQGNLVRIGASIGISACPDFASDTSNLLQTADTAMYVAKSRTKNTYHIYSPDI